MSWYLFNNSPQRQYRGKKVDGYQNLQKTKVILDWGLGQLSPKKTSKTTEIPIQKPNKKSKSQYQPPKKHARSIQKQKIIEQTVRILTQSSDEQGKQQLMRVLKKYDKKPQKNLKYNIRQSSGQLHVMQNNSNSRNRSMNIFNSFQLDSDKIKANLKNKNPVDLETAKRMRFLQSSLLPNSKRDNMSAVLDFDLNGKVADSMSDSRISGKSQFGNKKNESAVQLGDGFNSFVPLRQKVKDMNQKLKEMYDYDEWCKKRQSSQLKLG